MTSTRVAGVTLTIAAHGRHTMPIGAVSATLKAAGIDTETFNREA